MITISGSVSRSAAALSRCAPGAFLLSIFALSTSGCDGVTDPGPGAVLVSISTTGDDPDQNGYVIVVADRSVTASADAAIRLENIGAGDHTVSVEDVAHNCLVAGSNPRSVTVAPAAVGSVDFIIECMATGIEVKVTSSGQSVPDGFPVNLNGARNGTVNSNGSARVTYLAPGLYSVTLEIPEHCVSESAPSVNVASRTVVTVKLAVSCFDPVGLDKIAFTVSGSLGTAVAVINPNGSGLRTVVAGYSPSWSPDGIRLAVSTVSCPFYYYDWYPCTGGLRLVDAWTGGGSAPALASRGTHPAWSPMGDVIAFVRLNESGSAPMFVHLLSADGLQLDSFHVAGVHSVSEPAWSPEGQRIAFTCGVLSSAGTVTYDICVIDRGGGSLVRLTDTPESDGAAQWSPDGTRIAFTTYKPGAAEISLLDINTRQVTRLTSGCQPSWAPDGAKLVFGCRGGLFLINSDGSGETRITTGSHSEPTWRP